MGKPKKIFISFASQERDLAIKLQLFIKQIFNKNNDEEHPEFSVFVSDTTITAGELWETEIKKEIKEAELVFVLCSPLSISRQWVNFECGAASFNIPPPRIIPLCHSGLRRDKLISFAAREKEEAIDVHSLNFLMDVYLRVKEKYKIQVTETEQMVKANITDLKIKLKFDEVLQDMARRIDKNEEKKKKKSPKYLLVNLKRETKDTKEIIRIRSGGKSNPIVKPMQDEDIWLNSVKEMHKFVTNRSDSVGCIGIAIGVQNCLYDGSNIYVGVRMKSMEDAYSSSMGVAKGKFNTGYQLLPDDEGRKIESINNIQDLFVTKPKHIKQTVQKYEKSDENVDAKYSIYEKLKQRVEAVNSKLWNIVFDDGSTGVASIFVNNSSWFPRFEIGIWKFIDLSSPHKKIDGEIITCKTALDNYDGIIDGFGEDVFLDYRGHEDTQETPVNYWIWVKDGEICYWSYPEERLIPRKKPGKPPEKPMHAVLVTTKYMAEAYGNPFKYTPFASDEKLVNPDAVLADQFSLPARALLSCF